MARMECKCGETLSTTSVPNNVELWVYTDVEWDAILESDTIESWKFPSPKYSVWRCQKCERIYVFDDNKCTDAYTPAIKIYCVDE